MELIIALVIAVIGAVLGIINTIHQLSRDRVKIRVSPVFGHLIFEGKLSKEQHLGIQVVNLSVFPITISNVGLVGGFLKKIRGIVLSPIVPDGKPFPRRLEPRDSFLAFIAPKELEDENFTYYRKVFAVTICGKTKYGTSKSFRKYLRERKKIKK